MITLLETAVIERGESDSLLALGPSEDDGRYDWAEDDDRKQQSIALPGVREKHSDKEYADYDTGKAFIKGEGDASSVHENDVAQGSLGDCYLIAGMVAVARANPTLIEDLIDDHGDGTFTVTLYIRDDRYSKPKAVKTVIDARLPEKHAGTPLYAKLGDKSDGAVEMWPALLEKAVAQQKGSYDLISGGNIGKGGFTFKGASELLTGNAEGYMRTSGLDEDDALLHIALALDDKMPVTCDSKNMADDEEMSKEAVKYNVYGNHAYAPKSVDLDGRTISLTNPWGSSHVTDLPVADFLKYYRAIRINEGP